MATAVFKFVPQIGTVLVNIQEPHQKAWLPVKAAFSLPDQEPTLCPTAVTALLDGYKAMISSSDAEHPLHLTELAQILLDRAGIEGWLQMNLPLTILATAILFEQRHAHSQ